MSRSRQKQVLRLALFSLLLVSCIKEYSIENLVNNQVPNASAGEDITLTSSYSTPGPISSAPSFCTGGKDTVQLNASSSSDPDGSIVSFQWSFLNNYPANTGIDPIILNANQEISTVILNQPGDYWFSLTITDNLGATDLDTVKISSLPSNASVQLLNPVYLGTIKESDVRNIVVAGNKLFIQYGVDMIGANGNSGISPDKIKIFDFDSKTWSDLSLPFERYNLCMASSGNKVFFSGGVNFYQVGENEFGEKIYNKIDSYDIATGQWSNIELPGYFLPKASLVVDNKLIISGNNFDLVYSDEVNLLEILDLDAKTWTHANMSRNRAPNDIVVSGNEVFIAGGIKEQSPESEVVEIYNLATNTWRNSTIKSPGINLKGIALDNKIYWTNTGNKSSKNNPIEAWDINTGNSEFICLGDGLNNIYNFNHQILVSRNMSRFNYENTTYKNIELFKYDPSLSRWTIGRLPKDGKIIGGIGAIIGPPGQQRIIGIGYKEYPTVFCDNAVFICHYYDLEFWEISF
jgi:hypothetical protein